MGRHARNESKIVKRAENTDRKENKTELGKREIGKEAWKTNRSVCAQCETMETEAAGEMGTHSHTLAFPMERATVAVKVESLVEGWEDGKRREGVRRILKSTT